MQRKYLPRIVRIGHSLRLFTASDLAVNAVSSVHWAFEQLAVAPCCNLNTGLFWSSKILTRLSSSAVAPSLFDLNDLNTLTAVASPASMWILATVDARSPL